MRPTRRALTAGVPAVVVACAVLLIAQEPWKPFPVYDNMFYRGKPETTQYGLIPSNILYENKIWPNPRDVGELPKRDAFQDLVRRVVANPGPLVLDIEEVSFVRLPRWHATTP